MIATTHIQTLAIVGVGLLGGSVALAARKRGIAARIIGCDRNAETLECAMRLGMIDESSTDMCRAVSAASFVVFCTPVDRIADHIASCAMSCRAGTLITDVGSTKANVVRRLAGRMPPGVNFIGSHPLAGSEKAGPQHARSDLFENKLVILTPAGDPPMAVWAVEDFWRALGARVETMSPERHDQILAMTSHLPHLLASVLAGVLPLDWRSLTATGFRDTTRLAAGSPELWQAIFLSNQPALLEAVGQFQAHLDLFRDAVTRGDAATLRVLLEQGKYVRDSLS